ncbi:MAG: hypothetical protein RL224_77 [Actinomycetota bacterium]|jgi:hypothetical protein
MREAPSQSKNFHRIMKRIYGFLALAFFLIGAVPLPFLSGIGNQSGSQLFVGLAIVLPGILIPWGIGFWFFNLAMKRAEEPPTEEEDSLEKGGVGK